MDVDFSELDDWLGTLETLQSSLDCTSPTSKEINGAGGNPLPVQSGNGNGETRDYNAESMSNSHSLTMRNKDIMTTSQNAVQSIRLSFNESHRRDITDDEDPGTEKDLNFLIEELSVAEKKLPAPQLPQTLVKQQISYTDSFSNEVMTPSPKAGTLSLQSYDSGIQQDTSNNNHHHQQHSPRILPPHPHVQESPPLSASDISHFPPPPPTVDYMGYFHQNTSHFPVQESPTTPVANYSPPNSFLLPSSTDYNNKSTTGSSYTNGQQYQPNPNGYLYSSCDNNSTLGRRSQNQSSQQSNISAQNGQMQHPNIQYTKCAQEIQHVQQIQQAQQPIRRFQLQPQDSYSQKQEDQPYTHNNNGSYNRQQSPHQQRSASPSQPSQNSLHYYQSPPSPSSVSSSFSGRQISIPPPAASHFYASQHSFSPPPLPSPSSPSSHGKVPKPQQLGYGSRDNLSSNENRRGSDIHQHGSIDSLDSSSLSNTNGRTWSEASLTDPVGISGFPSDKHHQYTLGRQISSPAVTARGPSYSPTPSSSYSMHYGGVGSIRRNGRQSPCPTSSYATSSASTDDLDLLPKRKYEDSLEINNKIDQIVEKAQQLNLKKIVVRVFHQDKTTKAIIIDEHTTVGEACQLMSEKNFCVPSTKLSLVEKVPNLKMERCFEDHEILADCVLSWPEQSKNMIFFEDRPDKYGIFEDPKIWIGEGYPCTKGPLDQAAIQDIFGGAEPTLPDWKDYLHIKKPGEKTWTRRYCMVRSSGLYASRKKKSTAPADLLRIMVFDPNFHLYTTTGGWIKLKAPTPYGFAFKPYSAQDRVSKCVLYFCATDEHALRRWFAVLRIAKLGQQMLLNYESALIRSGQNVAEQVSTLSRRSRIDSARKASLDLLETTSVGSGSAINSFNCGNTVGNSSWAVPMTPPSDSKRFASLDRRRHSLQSNKQQQRDIAKAALDARQHLLQQTSPIISGRRSSSNSRQNLSNYSPVPSPSLSSFVSGSSRNFGSSSSGKKPFGM